ncbi:MAG: helix-turn-helix domain-containing protein [Candidatus Binataceae bacterium]
MKKKLREIHIVSFERWPEAMTPEEAAEYLRVPLKDIEQAINTGAIPAARIGNQWRVIKSKLIEKGGSRMDRVSGVPNSGVEERPLVGEFHGIEDFEFQWPDGTREFYRDAQEATASLRGRKFQVVVGFTKRPFAGKNDRVKATVFIDGLPVAEFGGSNDFETSGELAAVIKADGASQRHLRTDDGIPVAYAKYRVVPYNQIVRGKYASSGLAVACDRGDLKTMGEHALLRLDAKQRAHHN